MAQIAYGTITITDTTDIEFTIEYAKNQSTSNPPISGWSTNRPTWEQGYYIWQRTRIHKYGTNANTDTFSTAICLTGSTGNTGSTGQSLSSTSTQYTNVADEVVINNQNHTNYTWSDNIPTYDSTKPAYWGRITNVYTNPSRTDYIIYKDNAITEAIATAADAWNKANQAQTDASNALAQASQAIEDTALLGGHFVYNDEWQTEKTPHSANIIEIAQIERESEIEGEDSEIIDVTDMPSEWGYNVHIGANGIKIRKNEVTLSDWTEDALTFYTPRTDALEISTQLNHEGMIVNQGGIINNKLDYFPTSDIECVDGKTYYLQIIQTVPIEGGKTKDLVSYEVVSNPNNNDIENYYEYGFNERVKLYLSTEGYGSDYTINDYTTDKWRQIIGRYFGVTDEGYLYCSGAYINGRLDVIAGSNVYTKNEAQARLAELASTTGADKWKSTHSTYSLTTDAIPNENTIYYQGIYDYFPTSDIVLVNGKIYYIQTEQTIEVNNQQVVIKTYEQVTTPRETDIETYFEYGIVDYKAIDLQSTDNPEEMHLYVLDTITETINDYIQTHLSVEEDGLWLKGNNNNFKLQLTNQGMIVYDTSDNIISTFGENIEFSSNKRQKIGGENNFIEFNPTDDSLIINASQLHIGNTNVASRFDELDNNYQTELTEINNNLTTFNNTLNQRITDISEATNTFQNQLNGYIEIIPNESTLRVGKKSDDENNSYIEINADNPLDMRVSIKIRNKEVAYFNNERLYAPSAVVTNLYMQTTTGDGNTVGTMGWLMRSNGHLSLKEIE